jgi:hypothetical protein
MNVQDISNLSADPNAELFSELNEESINKDFSMIKQHLSQMSRELGEIIRVSYPESYNVYQFYVNLEVTIMVYYLHLGVCFTYKSHVCAVSLCL